MFWRPNTLVLAEVVTREIGPAVQGVGTVEAKVTVAVAAKITGRVVVIAVDQGDTVRAGQILVRLKDAELVADVERASAALGREGGAAVIVVTHDERMLEGFDRVYHMTDGRISNGQ